jgi:hypothetical protein
MVFAAVSKAETPFSNSELVSSAVLHLFEPVVGKIDGQDTGVRLQYGAVKGERRGFLNQLLIGYFTEKGVSVNRSDAAYELNIEHFIPEFVYKQENSALLGLSDTYQRTLSLRFKGWLSAAEGEVLYVMQEDTNLTDRIRETEISMLEADPYMFLKGKKVETSGWARMIEPALVVLSVSTIVYLFFIMRS